MRHDKLRQYAESSGMTQEEIEANGANEPIIPHQSVANDVNTPSQMGQNSNMGQANEAESANDYEGEPEIQDQPQDEFQNVFAQQNQNEPMEQSVEEQAMAMGWRPKEEWRGNPDDWVSAKRFVQTGELIQSKRSLENRLNTLESTMDQRLERLQMYHEAKRQQEIQALERQQEEMVERGDLEGYKAKKDEIDKLKMTDENQGFFGQQSQVTTQEQPQEQPQLTPPQQPQQPTFDPNNIDYSIVMRNIAQHPVVQNWAKQNPYVLNNDSKALFAQRQLENWVKSNASNPNATLEQGLAFVDNIVADAYRTAPQQQQQPQQTAFNRSNRRPANRPSDNHGLTMNDLTRQELQIWNSMGKNFKDKNEFLQTVADDRRDQANG